MLADHERVEILCHDESVRDDAKRVARRARRNARTSGCTSSQPIASGCAIRRRPACSRATARSRSCNWQFNAWAKYPNFERDAHVGEAIARITGLERVEPTRPDGDGRVVLEGGGIETDGEGTLLVTEEWLLSDVQVRNPGLDRAGYERVFADALGARQTIWLGEGCVGDDTHGHVDDIARFTAPGVIVLAYEPDPADENHRRSADNYDRLMLAGGAAERFASSSCLIRAP